MNRTRTILVIALWSLVPLLGWAGSSGAQGSWPPAHGSACRPSPEEVRDSAHLVRLTARASADEQIVYLKRAYERDCSNHSILLVLARAYEARGQFFVAADTYRIYLERAQPNPTDRIYLERKIGVLATTAPSSARVYLAFLDVPDDPFSASLPPTSRSYSDFLLRPDDPWGSRSSDESRLPHGSASRAGPRQDPAASIRARDAVYARDDAEDPWSADSRKGQPVASRSVTAQYEQGDAEDPWSTAPSGAGSAAARPRSKPSPSPSSSLRR